MCHCQTTQPPVILSAVRREESQFAHEERFFVASLLRMTGRRGDLALSLSSYENVLITLPAHFDGVQIRLDVGVELKPDMRLLVTIPGEGPSNETLVWNAMKASEAAFARVWDNEEDAIYDGL